MFGGVPGLDLDVKSSEWQFIGDSTCINSVRYKSGNLAIKFQDGTTYTYFDVHPFVYGNLIRSTSKGYFFNHNIRDNYSSSEGDFSEG